MIRKSKGSSDDDPVVPLDEDEQEKELLVLKTIAESNSTNTRTMFFLLYFLISIIFAVVLVYSFIFPWDMSHQHYFKNIFLENIHIFHGFYVASLTVNVVSACIVRYGKDNLSLYYRYLAYVISSATLLLWTIIFYIELVQHPALYWLPLGNIASLLLAIYVDNDCKGLIEDADGMKKYKYEYKAV